MAFIREYSEQGDPFGRGRALRAGRLIGRPLAQSFGRGARKSRAALVLRRRVLAQIAGDPFSFRMPKALRKLSLKKVATAVGKVAKAALPIAAPFIPGVGPFLAPLLGAAFAGGGGPDTAAPELVQQPEYRGPVGTIAEPSVGPEGYNVIPGVEVSAEAPRRSRFARFAAAAGRELFGDEEEAMYPGDFDESDYSGNYGPDDEDEDADFDESYDEED